MACQGALRATSVQAAAVLDQIRIRLSERAGNDDIPRYTFSGGVAEYPADGDEATLLLGRADDRLYAAKEAGRNRIFVLDPVPVPAETSPG